MAAAEPITLVIDGQLAVLTATSAVLMREAWPKWREGIDWAVGALSNESDAGRALLAANLLCIDRPKLAGTVVGTAGEKLSAGDVVVHWPGGVIRRAA